MYKAILNDDCLHIPGVEIQRRLSIDAAMTEEDLAYAHLCRAVEESQIIIARDAAMNEAQLNTDCFHISEKKTQRRLARDVAMHKSETNADSLHRSWEEV